MNMELVWIILGMALATGIPRFLPVALLSRLEFPEVVKEWLSNVPPAVLAALVAVSVLAPQGIVEITLANRYIWVFVPTLAVAVYSKSPFYTLVAGIALMALLNNLFM
ncbi:MAG: AzlD domain-containing protein [Syntrophomonadaceae bacterium]|nr:AzlD domain-containing protein [Syntrophomonadaceae bacterium]